MDEKNQFEKERWDIARIMSQNFHINGEGWDDSDFEWTAHCLQMEGYRKQSENATLEAVDKFRSALMDKFIDLCRGNDFNKINLLLIGETIYRTFDDVVVKMKGGVE